MPRPRQTIETFWEKVDKTGNCWLWTAKTESNGYGRVKFGGKSYGAHRLAYEWVKGEIPQGLSIDHLCRVRNCVNPDHLEAVTHQENQRRAKYLTIHCPSGHPYSGENLGFDIRGHRFCKECSRLNTAKYKRRKKARQ